VGLINQTPTVNQDHFIIWSKWWLDKSGRSG